jgi:subtilase family protein
MTQTTKGGAAALLALLTFALSLSAQEETPNSPGSYASPETRAAAVAREELAWRERAARVRAGLARLEMEAKGTTRDGRFYEVVDIRPDGRPVIYITHNANAAISTGADQVRNSPQFGSVDGSTVRVGVWDGGRARETHQEYGGRILPSDTAGISSHATHVTGTIGASGVNVSAQGMAPGTTVLSFGWGSDTSEATIHAAASVADQLSQVTISNHSYGIASGWEFGSWSGNTGWHWFGSANDIEDSEYGGYRGTARNWDALVYNAPYFLPFRSAGNDRGDGPPAVGETWYYSSGGWQSKTYDPATDPVEDGDAGGVAGYDCVAQAATAKNIVTVGASTDAVSGGQRSIAAANTASFSAYGPMDDGRIKPDIVANGVSLQSTGSASDTAYYNSSGTSMSSPNAAGSAVLLRDLFEFRLPGASLRASTLKGLILHSADDKGNPGPDYAWGWGLMNVERAAQIIDQHAGQPVEGLIREETLSNGGDLQIPLTATGTEDLVVTICWTDPAGALKSGVDNPQPDLVNDLDLRATRLSDTTQFFPWILDPANPLTPAQTGDNVVDNVEQIAIANPGAGEQFLFEISHKGNLSGGNQVVSVIISGAASSNLTMATASQIGVGCGGAFAGMPNIVPASDPVLGENFTILGVGAPVNANGVIYGSPGFTPPTPLPGGCDLWLDPASAFEVAFVTPQNLGYWIVSTPIPNLPALEGYAFRLQAFFPSAASSWGWANTGGLECVIGY